MITPIPFFVIKELKEKEHKLMDKDFLQHKLSERLNYVKQNYTFNKRQLEGYETTILRYKSRLHNTPENEIDNFYHCIFEEEKRQKQLCYWTDFQTGKEEAVIDIATILRQYLD